MTNEELQAIRERCDAATPGKWISGRDADFLRPLQCFNVALERKAFDSHGDSWSQWDANAVFIAHARADIPALLDEVARLRAERCNLWRFVKPEEGVPVVYVGVHVVRWYEAAGEYEPTAGFVQAETTP